MAVLVKRVEDPLRYGVVALDGGAVKEIAEKPSEAASHLVSTGIYAFDHQIFSFIEPELGLPDVMNKMIAQECTVVAQETEGTWLDVIYPWDILNLNGAILRRVGECLGGIVEPGVVLKGEVSVGRDTVIRSNSYIVGPAVIGEGCDIGPNVCIFPATSVGNNVVIEPFTVVKNSIIGDDVSIGAGGTIQDSVIDKGCILGGHFTASSGQEDVRFNEECHLVMVGAMLGEGCSVGNGVVAQPGVIMGNYSQVKPLKLLSGRLPDRSLVF
jgi:glucose-1-phosphate thymidylyltransferase